MTRTLQARQASATIDQAQRTYEIRLEAERAIAMDAEFRRFMGRCEEEREDFCEAAREDRALLCERWELEVICG